MSDTIVIEGPEEGVTGAVDTTTVMAAIRAALPEGYTARDFTLIFDYQNMDHFNQYFMRSPETVFVVKKTMANLKVFLGFAHHLKMARAQVLLFHKDNTLACDHRYDPEDLKSMVHNFIEKGVDANAKCVVCDREVELSLRCKECFQPYHEECTRFRSFMEGARTRCPSCGAEAEAQIA